MDEELLLDAEAEQVQEQLGDKSTADIIGKLRKENARRRVEARERAREAEEAAKRAQDIEARYQELAAQFENKEKEANARNAELDGILKGLEETNQKVISELPEDMQAIVPSGLGALQLRQWLDRAAPVLTKRVAPRPEGAAGPPEREGARLSEAELQMAARLGISPEAYAKNKRE